MLTPRPLNLRANWFQKQEGGPLSWCGPLEREAHSNSGGRGEVHSGNNKNLCEAPAVFTPPGVYEDDLRWVGMAFHAQIMA